MKLNSIFPFQIQDLDLTDDVLITSKSAPAAQNRFIYYPDRLVRMPGPGTTWYEGLTTILQEPVFAGLFKAIYNDIRTDPRPDSVQDESVGHFVARRGDKRLANNLLSALFHGIYAGDVWQLSAKSIMGLPWAREKKHGSLAAAALSGALGRVSWNFCDDVEMQVDMQNTDWDEDLRERIRDCSVYTFKEGLGMLPAAIEKSLHQNKNISILQDTVVTEIGKDGTSNVKVLASLDLLHLHTNERNRSPTSQPTQKPPSP